MVRGTITTEVRGTEFFGSPFDDRSFVKDLETSFIQRIVITHSDYVTSLTVFYNDCTSGVTHAGYNPPGLTSEISLEAGEFITTVTGSSLRTRGEIINLITLQRFHDQYTVGHLAVTSNKGKTWGPFGTTTGGDYFTWDCSNIRTAPGTRMGLLYFAGSFSSTLWHLQATFAEHSNPSPPAPEVKYDRGRTWEIGPEVPSSLPQFARNLMSPLVLLQTGTTRVSFHAHEDIICRLPFFRAALQGGFREAIEKIVKMPDDEPDIIAALLEFLYRGSYTYIVDSADTEDPPAKGIDEALFHIRLHALACKYDCEALAVVERRSMAYVLDGLNGMDIAVVVREMFESGWVIGDHDGGGEMASVAKRIPGIIRELYGACEEELHRVRAECPEFAAELVRLMALS